jgi:hypothetical protein
MNRVSVQLRTFRRLPNNKLGLSSLTSTIEHPEKMFWAHCMNIAVFRPVLRWLDPGPRDAPDRDNWMHPSITETNYHVYHGDLQSGDAYDGNHHFFEASC